MHAVAAEDVLSSERVSIPASGEEQHGSSGESKRRIAGKEAFGRHIVGFKGGIEDIE